MKKEKILQFSKKHPSWGVLFCSWLEKDKDLDVDKLEEAFAQFLEFKHLIKKEITIETISEFVVDDTINVAEKFHDAVYKAIFNGQALSFIKSLKTQKYQHLFTEKIEGEIYTILENRISIESLKTQFFNKLASFESSDELFKELVNFKNKNIEWNKESTLQKIKKLLNKKSSLFSKIHENFDCVSVIENKNNTLMIEVFNYMACRALGSQAWCIVRNETDFNGYLSGDKNEGNRQFIYFDFNLPIENSRSMIGFTTNIIGKIKHSHLRNDQSTPASIYQQFSFPSADDEVIKTFLSYSRKPLNFIVENELLGHLDDKLNKILNLTDTEIQDLFLKASKNGDIFEKLFKYYLSEKLSNRISKYLLLNVSQSLFLGNTPEFFLHKLKIPNFSLIRYIEKVLIPSCFELEYYGTLDVISKYSKHFNISKETCLFFSNDPVKVHKYMSNGFFD